MLIVSRCCTAYCAAVLTGCITGLAGPSTCSILAPNSKTKRHRKLKLLLLVCYFSVQKVKRQGHRLTSACSWHPRYSAVGRYTDAQWAPGGRPHTCRHTA